MLSTIRNFFFSFSICPLCLTVGCLLARSKMWTPAWVSWMPEEWTFKGFQQKVRRTERGSYIPDQTLNWINRRSNGRIVLLCFWSLENPFWYHWDLLWVAFHFLTAPNIFKKTAKARFHWTFRLHGNGIYRSGVMAGHTVSPSLSRWQLRWSLEYQRDCRRMRPPERGSSSNCPVCSSFTALQSEWGWTMSKNCNVRAKFIM